MVDEDTDEDYASYMSKGSTIVFSALFISSILGVVLRVFLARSFTTEEYGLLFAVVGFVSFFSTFRNLGIRAAITKFVSEYREEGKLDDIKSTLTTSFVIMGSISVALAIVFIVLSGWLSRTYFDHPLAQPVLIVLSIWGVGTMTQNYLRNTFQAFRDMAGNSGVRLVRLLFTLILVVIVVYIFGSGIIGISLAYLTGSVLSTAVFYVLLKVRHSEFLLGEGSFSKSRAKNLLSFGLPLVFSGIAGSILGWTDTLMLTGLRNLSGVGLYQVARPTARFLGYFGMAVGIPFFPMVSEIWARDEKETLSSVISLLSKFSVVLVVPALIILLVYPDIVITLVYGSEYLGAVTALRILAIGTIFLAGARIFAQVLKGTDHTQQHLKSSVIAAGFNILANLVLIPPYGAGGAAIATSLSYLIMLIIRFYFSKKIIDFSVPSIEIGKSLVCGFASFLLLFALKKTISLSPWFEAPGVIIPVMVFYLLSIFRTGVVTREDLKILERSTPIPKKLINIADRLS